VGVPVQQLERRWLEVVATPHVPDLDQSLEDLYTGRGGLNQSADSVSGLRFARSRVSGFRGRELRQISERRRMEDYYFYLRGMHSAQTQVHQMFQALEREMSSDSDHQLARSWVVEQKRQAWRAKEGTERKIAEFKSFCFRNRSECYLFKDWVSEAFMAHLNRVLDPPYWQSEPRFFESDDSADFIDPSYEERLDYQHGRRDFASPR
jgi:hypothetical protein